jgi:hypothetical protein
MEYFGQLPVLSRAHSLNRCDVGLMHDGPMAISNDLSHLTPASRLRIAPPRSIVTRLTPAATVRSLIAPPHQSPSVPVSADIEPIPPSH